MARYIGVDAMVRGGESADGRVRGKVFSDGLVEISNNLQQYKAETMLAFAKEVRRRARIRLAINRSPYPSGSDTRVPGPLSQDIEFTISSRGGATDRVAFDVGAHHKQARIEDQDKDGAGTIIYGNPTMKFFWYRFGQPRQFRRPGFIIRKGKNFFTGALTGALQDIDKIGRRSPALKDRVL